MKYSIVWQSRAEQDLAALWLSASDRSEINSACNRIEQLLQNRPATVGEWLYGTTRVLIVVPLAVAFDVIEDDKVVRVLTIWREE